MNNTEQQAAVKTAQIRQLYAASKLSLSVSALLALLLAYMQQEVIAPTVVYTWLSFVLLLCAVRLFVIRTFDRAQTDENFAVNTWLNKFRLGIFASGLVWGSSGYLLFPVNDTQHQLFLVFMLSGLSAGSFISFAVDRVSSTAFYTLTLLPIAVKLFSSGGNVSVAMGVAVILYFTYMMISSRHVNQTLMDNILLRIQALDREQAIKVSEERYRLLLNHSPVGIFHYDTQLKVTYCNERFGKIMQAPLENITGSDLSECTDNALVEPMQNALQGAVTHYDGWYDNASNTDLWIDMTCAPSRDSAGNIEGGIAIVRDVTESKQAEEMLRIGAIAFETQTAMIVTKANFVILRVNPAFTELTGYQAKEVIGKTPRMLDSGRHDKAFFQAILASLQQTGHWQGEIWNKRKNGLIDAEWMNISAVTRSDGKTTHYVVSFSDITENKDAVAEIHRLAYYDPLTHLPNRRLLQDRLGQELAAANRSGMYGAILFLDLDNFKALNDTRGHDAGDQLLVEVAQRLCTDVRAGDIVGRLGGDEFVVLVDNLSLEADEAALHAQKIAEKLLVSLALPYTFEDFEFHCSTSIGIRLFREHEAVDGLLRHADMAMYHAKTAGRNTLRFFDPDMETKVANRVEMEKDLRYALEHNQFELCFQSLVRRDKIIGAEVLVFWQHPERGLILPKEFIHLAEKTDLILPIGQWVLESACTQIKQWQHNPLTQQLQLAVNVSVRQFRHADFIELVNNALTTNGISPNLLKLELTESMLLDNIDDIISKMHELKKIGVRLALDDFGTGYSSLSYLTQLPIDELKIDQSFVGNICTKPEDASIVQTIIGMAQNLNINVIAEGVETEEQRAFLAEQGCHTCQGFLFSRPVSIDKFEKMLK